MKLYFFTLVFLLMFVDGFGQPQKNYSFASQPYRDSITNQLKNMVDQTLKLPVNDSSSSKWSGAFWAMELMLYRPDGYEQVIPIQLEQLPQTPISFQRSFLEMLYVLYPNRFAGYIQKLWFKLHTNTVKAMALEYLRQSGIFIKPAAGDTFFNSDYYLLYSKRAKLAKNKKPAKRDFLNPSFLSGETLLCSFQSPDRDIPGYLMIRTSDGTWLEDDKGEPLRFTQLARSITNFPYYINNGNTPQGLYKVTGFDSSSNHWIGPSTNLQLSLPFENGVAVFFGVDTLFGRKYSQLLGPLKNYSALWETYEAGRIGRSEIIAHGTTIDPNYYKQEKYFPNTPSMGCLCSPELWNAKGELEKSIQEAWIKKVKCLAKMPGYLIVAEVKDL